MPVPSEVIAAGQPDPNVYVEGSRRAMFLTGIVEVIVATLMLLAEITVLIVAIVVSMSINSPFGGIVVLVIIPILACFSPCSILLIISGIFGIRMRTTTRSTTGSGDLAFALVIAVFLLLSIPAVIYASVFALPLLGYVTVRFIGFVATIVHIVYLSKMTGTDRNESRHRIDIAHQPHHQQSSRQEMTDLSGQPLGIADIGSNIEFGSADQTRKTGELPGILNPPPYYEGMRL